MATKNIPSMLCFFKTGYYFCNPFNGIVPLCNGSTTDFGSVSLGSNPGGTTRNIAKAAINLKIIAVFFIA